MTMLRHALLLSLLACGPALWGQSLRGWIAGQVSDSAGKPVGSANVTITSPETGRSRALRTDEDGRFQAVALPPATYRIETTAAGLMTHVQNLALAVNQQVELRISLDKAGTRQQIDVVGTAPLLRTESATLGGTIYNQQVIELPLDGRNYYELSLLLPGVLPGAQGAAGSVRGDFAVSVNGMREDSNSFLLDGVYNIDPKLNGVGLTPPVDGIREFEVESATYDASFGRNAGAQMNVVLKSGTNSLHGTLYHFVRNQAMDARNFFSPAGERDPRYQRNQYGFSLGGPIRKDRAFFFGDWEGRRVREGSARQTNVPTARERQGDFSASRLPYLIDPFTQQPFPGSVVPATRQHPVGRALAALYPLPNRPVAGLNFASAPVGRDASDNFDLRGDVLAGRSEISARYSFNDRDLFEPFSGPSFAQVPGYGARVPRRSHNLMIGDTWVLSPALVSETRFGWQKVTIGVFHENQGRSVNRAVGLPELSTRERDFGLSFISALGYTPLGDEYNNPQQTSPATTQVIQQFTWLRGASLFKFGGDARWLRQDGYRDVQSRGFINFVGFTGNALAEMLQGLVSYSGGARLDNRQMLRGRSASLFGHLSHKLRPGLTLSAGMRYELNTPPVDPEDRANLYDVATGRLVQPGTAGMPRAGYLADRNNFAPRVGLAWNPGGGGTVLRAGYGIHYDLSSLAPSEGLYFNAPYFNFRIYYPFGNSLVTLSDPFPANFPLPTPPSAFAFDRALRTPYVQQWSGNVQQRIGTGRVMEIGYVGTKGTRLYGGRDINQPRPSTAQFALRPNPQFDDINRLESRGNSVYHALQAMVRQQLRGGLTLIGSYTYGKSLDDASGFFTSAGDPNFPQDSYNLAAERGRSNFDLRQRFVFSWSYRFPRLVRGGFVGGFFSGWQCNGIWSLQTGRPFTVALPSELDNSNTGRSSLGFGANDRPHLVGVAKLDNPTVERWFNPGAFVVPARGTFGTAGRNILDGPGLAAMNVSVLKDTLLREGLTLQLRAEGFNAFNRANFNLPQNFLGAAGFASITSAANPRLMQLGAKLLF
jgi:hypothetical protein